MFTVKSAGWGLAKGTEWAFSSAPPATAKPVAKKYTQNDLFQEVRQDFDEMHKQMKQKIEMQQQALQTFLKESTQVCESDPNKKWAVLGNLVSVKKRLEKQMQAIGREQDVFINDLENALAKITSS